MMNDTAIAQEIKKYDAVIISARFCARFCARICARICGATAAFQKRPN
jgi:hypothetical protein